ncbi:MAG: sodium:solute symporter [Acidobacteriota bacterium]
MRPIDWVVLASWLTFIVAWGVWRGGRSRTIDGFLLAGREMRWGTVALSIMATQASAITFLSTPGQAYADGMRFVQFYLGLPLAMIVLSIVAVPLYHRLRVFTAYEFLEGRFDLKTRVLTASLFLVQRGLAAGLTIYAPSLILSVMLGWDIRLTIAIIGGLVVIYTTSGGTRAVSRTHTLQAAVILVGMAAALVVLIRSLPPGVSYLDALHVAGAAGRLNAIDASFSLTDRYTLWSGLIGGFFLALSYFGTDQSQVQRYLTGRSIGESRMGLLINGVVKVPMQFGVLLIGASVFAFYQFVRPPIFFNPVEAARVRASASGERFTSLESEYADATQQRATAARQLADAFEAGDPAREVTARQGWAEADARTTAVRRQAVGLITATDPRANPSDTNYVFLSFVLHQLPAGLVGLLLAAVFAAAMNSTSAELNALAATTAVDIYRRLVAADASERHLVRVSRLATVFWGAFAVLFAEFANRLGSLVEAVNILGSLFYGTILGIFLLAFSRRRPSGTAVFVAAVLAEAAVVACYALTSLSFLWYNVVGCAAVIVGALALYPLLGRGQTSRTT